MSINFQIVKVESGPQKSEICNKILRALPKWFGIESSIIKYVEDVQSMETWAAQIDEQIVGFISLNKHNNFTAEVHVIGLLENYHRQQIGKKLIEKAEESLHHQGIKFLQVKTLSPSHPDENYARTRQFYFNVGFIPVEEFKTLWGEHNPCLLLIKEISKSIKLSAIGKVISTRKEVIDDNWDNIESYIELDSTKFSSEALAGLDSFSHVEILFFMNQVDTHKIETSARHPRNNLDWPKVGIFSQRGKSRPNQIGTTICQIQKIEGLKLYVKGLDAVDGTPVLDIKPWVKEFGPRGEIRQPSWMTELMKGYWV